MVQPAPTLDQIGASADVQKILEGAAHEVIKERTERWQKQSSTVRYGDKMLPERVTVYRRLTGRAVELPTATIGQSLAKRAADGGAVFVRTQGECTGSPPAFIDRECEVCREVSGKPKRFYKESNFRGHMRGFHELEWEEIQRQEERDERRLDRELLAAAIRGEVKVGGNDAEQITCPQCGKPVKSAFGLQAHQRSHLSAVSE